MRLKIPFIVSIFIFSHFISLSQTNAGADQEVCEDKTTLAADPPPAGYTGLWENIGGGGTLANPSLYNTELTGLYIGYNEYKWTITNGVDTYSDNVIITNNYPTQAQTAGNEEVCQHNHYLNANIFGTGESGLWTCIEGSGNIATPDNNYSEVSQLGQGVNKFEWKISKSICHSEDTVILTNNTVQANAGNAQTTCENFIELNASNPSPGTGTWSVVSSFDNPVFEDIHDPNTRINGLGIDENALQWTVQKGSCSAYSNVIITSRKPTLADAGDNRTTCENFTTLSGNNPTNGTGTWDVVSGNGSFADAGAYNTQVNFIDIGLNKYAWTIDYYGCKSSDTVEITYDYFIANAGSDDSTCINSYTLNANTPANGTGKWTVISGYGFFDDETQATTTVSQLLPGENTLEWKITHGLCEAVDYVTISVNTPSTANAGPDKFTCNGTLKLAAVYPAIGTGSWTITSGSGQFSNTLHNNPIVSEVGLNENIYRWTVKNGICSSYDEVVATNNFIAADAGPDQEICGTNASLNAVAVQAGATGQWKVLSGTSSLANSNLYNSQVNNISSGNNSYRWTVSKGNCSDYDDVIIVNNKYYASASVSGSPNICDNFASIIGNTPPSGGYGYWKAVSGTGVFDNSMQNSTIVRNLAMGENILRWTLNKNDCEDFSDIQINRNSAVADAGDNQSTCDFNIQLNATPVGGNLTGKWERTSGLGSIANPSLYNTEVTGLANGPNTFKWTVSGNGCEDSDVVEITNNSFLTNAGSDDDICDFSTELSASNPSPGYGYWQVENGNGTFANPSSNTTMVHNIPQLSINEYKWTAFKNGCYAEDIIVITNNAVTAEAGNDTSVCNSQASLSANNPAPGTGEWTVVYGNGSFSNPNAANCEISGLNLRENIIRWTISHGECSTYDELTINNNHVSATAGNDDETCNDYTQLLGQAPPSGGTGLWEVVEGNSHLQTPTLYNTQVNNLTSGTNTFRWTVFYKGCSSSGDEVSINNKGFTADAGSNQVLDQFVTSTNLAATLPPGGTGYWLPLSGGGDIADINDPNTAVTNIPSGINEYMWNVSYNDCTADAVVSVTVVNFQANTGIDKTVCSDSLKLNAQNMGGTPQYWSVEEGNGNFDNINDPATWVRDIAEGINRYRWTVNLNGVFAYDEITITRVNANAGPDQGVCEDYAQLTGNIPLGSIGAEWLGLTGNSTIQDPTNYTTEVTGLNGGNNIFSWTVYAPNCIVSDYVNIQYESIFVNAGDDKIICGSTSTLDGNIPNAGTSGHWSVIEGNAAFENDSLYNTDIYNINIGNNIFRWTVEGSICTIYDEVSVLNDSITADAGSNQTVSQAEAYLDALLPSGANGVWNVNFGSGIINDINDPNAYVQNLSAGENIFTWTVNNANCSDADNVTIIYDSSIGTDNIEKEFEIFPSITKDYVTIKNNTPKSYNIVIYNSSGLKIQEKICSENMNYLNLSMFAPGVYFIKVSNSIESHTYKVVKL